MRTTTPQGEDDHDTADAELLRRAVRRYLDAGHAIRAAMDSGDWSDVDSLDQEEWAARDALKDLVGWEDKADG